MINVSEIIFLILSGSVFLFLLWATIVSKIENEKLATQRFLLLSSGLLIFTVMVFLFHNSIPLLGFNIGIGTLISLGILLFLPMGRKSDYALVIPQTRLDERDTMFSRRELKPGSEDFINYYIQKPEFKNNDDGFRKKPGILGVKSSQYNPFHYASSHASFGTIEGLYNEVDGHVNKEITDVGPNKISKYIKAWSLKLGAIDSGITELKDYHVYSVGGRHERRNIPYERKHNFAFAFTVEMDKQMVDNAPSAGIVMESGQQYLESGRVAIQLAKFIRHLGYEARAHIDGNYEVVCPLVARDAGLGDIGRMGLLMTPKHGPRVRIGVVTTNMPLVVDMVKPDFSAIDFCTICKKCADSCPSQAISFDDREIIDGSLRWQINQEACFNLWCSLGTDCGRCVSVCPYSHEDNLLHNIIRKGIKNNYVFRRMALKMDDVFYGRKPSSKEIPKSLVI